VNETRKQSPFTIFRMSAKPRKRCHDITEILLKVALNSINTINREYSYITINL